ncbi:hypothetical protein VTJ04DRAFT_42 [Mycothermus thermophilus]|uniref:uncharacterized protein n=1 Tax=Humicola insolens TaxID=85995 RepID=UPI0037424D64
MFIILFLSQRLSGSFCPCRLRRRTCLPPVPYHLLCLILIIEATGNGKGWLEQTSSVRPATNGRGNGKDAAMPGGQSFNKKKQPPSAKQTLRISHRPDQPPPLTD